MNASDINFENLLPAQLVDLCGVLAAEEKRCKERRDAVSKKLIELGVLPLNGNHFKAQVVEATTAWHLNREQITLEMGQAWIDQRSKPSLRAAYVLVKPLPATANALKSIAA